MNEAITDLMHRYLSGDLTASEAAGLTAAMQADPALAKEFAALAKTASGSRTEEDEEGADAVVTRPRRGRSGQLMAAIAGCAILFGFGWSLLQWTATSVSRAGRSKSASPRPDPGSAALPFSDRGVHRSKSAALTQKLRRFFVTNADIRRHPVSRALATLADQWKSTAHRNPADAAGVTFSIPEAVRRQWNPPGDEPLVSLEIPGISLLTCLEVIAAQAGLRVTITGAGVSLDQDFRNDDGKVRRWTIPLSAAALGVFLHRNESAESGRRRTAADAISPKAEPPGPRSTAGEADAPPASDTKAADIMALAAAVRSAYEERRDFAELRRILRAHGAPETGTDWSAESGLLTVRGPIRQCRAARAVAAAIRESAADGAFADTCVIEWPTGQIPTPTASPVSISDLEAQDLFAAETVASWTWSDALPFGDDLETGTAFPPPANGSTGRLTGIVIRSPERSGGEFFRVPEVLITTGGSTKTIPLPLPVPDGGWIRFDVAAEGEHHPSSVLIRIQSTPIPLE